MSFTPMEQAHWRAMAKADLDGVVSVARVAFPDHFEDRFCFAERLTLYPQGCFTLDTGDGNAAGYLIAYPWIASSAPPLNTLIGALPASPTLLYLHDLALHPDARGHGLTTIIVERLATQARADGWKSIVLVAVNEATDFWIRQRFSVVNDPAMAEKLVSYGGDARYMIRHIED